MHDHDIKGNKEADKLADRAAEIAELPSWLVDPLIDTIRMVRCIQLRLATIVCNLPRRQYKKSINHGRAPVLDSKGSGNGQIRTLFKHHQYGGAVFGMPVQSTF